MSGWYDGWQYIPRVDFVASKQISIDLFLSPFDLSTVSLAPIMKAIALGVMHTQFG